MRTHCTYFLRNAMAHINSFLASQLIRCLWLSPTHPKPLWFRHHLCSSQSGHLFFKTNLKLNSVSERGKGSSWPGRGCFTVKTIHSNNSGPFSPHSTASFHNPKTFYVFLHSCLSLSLSPNTSDHSRKQVILIAGKEHQSLTSPWWQGY